MPSAKRWKIAAGVGVVLVLIGAITASSGDTQLVFEPGDTANVTMGQAITVKLPRGEYEMVGGGEQIQRLSTKDVGDSTIITLLVGAEAVDYEITVRFVDVEGEQFDLDIEAEVADA